MNCPRCGKPTQCLSGCSAHPLNWYCSDEENCGWHAWTAAVENNVHRSEELCEKKVRALIDEVDEMSKFSFSLSMDDFIAALKEKSDPDKLTFFKMEGPVALHEGQAFVAKSRGSRVRYSKMHIEDLVSIHGEGAAETLRRMIIDELVAEMLSELQSVTGKTVVGIYQIVSENVGMGTQGFILRYAVGPGVA